MEAERIGLVLGRASELRLKMSNLDDDAESLFNIIDALQSLEAQLSSLQALQQQQWYEKEAALAEIEYSQKKLLQKLEEFEEKDLEVIHEAIAFVGETVDDNKDLLLPPYPSRPSPTLGSDSEYLSNLVSTRKYPPNGLISNSLKKELSNDRTSTGKNQIVPESNSPFRGIKALLGAAAKATFTVIGFVCVLSLAGFETRLRKGDNQLNIWGLVPHRQDISEKKETIECPPGRIPVIEDGEVRYLVKERVEIPFGSVVATPDVNYGFG
ncbi:hypothetical protein LIER_37449 [Lithospermum erythrorhizon]|uniref:Plastid division protein PDV2 n=1 Tax=Lithospermum erythrorhizon TaxID=34254 RepID=A0AAV3PPI7_LITER